MSFRSLAPVVVLIVSALVLGACGASEEGDTLGGEPALTAELVVPPAEQEVVAATVPPTATAVPTATEAVEVVKEVDEDEALRVHVANRSYNVMGSDDAPITMFDFSDFL